MNINGGGAYMTISWLWQFDFAKSYEDQGKLKQFYRLLPESHITYEDARRIQNSKFKLRTMSNEHQPYSTHIHLSSPQQNP
jgi:hypothetical protein